MQPFLHVPCFGSDAFAPACLCIFFAFLFFFPLLLCDAMCFAMLCHALPFSRFAGASTGMLRLVFPSSPRQRFLLLTRFFHPTCRTSSYQGVEDIRRHSKTKVSEHLGTFESGFITCQIAAIGDFMGHFVCHLSHLSCPTLVP